MIIGWVPGGESAVRGRATATAAMNNGAVSTADLMQEMGRLEKDAIAIEDAKRMVRMAIGKRL